MVWSWNLHCDTPWHLIILLCLEIVSGPQTTYYKRIQKVYAIYYLLLSGCITSPSFNFIPYVKSENPERVHSPLWTMYLIKNLYVVRFKIVLVICSLKFHIFEKLTSCCFSLFFFFSVFFSAIIISFFWNILDSDFMCLRVAPKALQLPVLSFAFACNAKRFYDCLCISSFPSRQCF